MADLSEDARVDADAVKEIFDTDLTDAQMNAFINTANNLVTEELGNAGLSADRLTEIEKYLSAHFAALRDPRFAQEAIGDYRYQVQGKTEIGLDSTYYGQQAKLLDSSGILSTLNMTRRQAVLEVLAKD